MRRFRCARRWWVVVVVCGVAGVLAGCAGPPQQSAVPSTAGAGFPVTVATCGHSSVVRARPRRAVTVNQGATEIALALGVGDQLAGTAYLDNPAPGRWQDAYRRVPVLSKEYPGKEQLLAARPDFVYATFSSAFAPDAVGPQADLDRLGVPSLLSPFGCPKGTPRGPVRWDTVWSEITDAGRAFGVPDRARAVVDGQRGTIDRVTGAHRGGGRTALWFDSGDRTPYVGAGQGGPQLIMQSVGLRNIFANLPGGWADGSWETIAAANPEVIILADAGFSTAREKIARLRGDPALRSLTAVAQNRFVVLPFDESTPGVTLADGAAAVSDQLATR